MSLAKVVYTMSIDREFAVQWNEDPESALEKKGLQLSHEELAFLSSGIKNGQNGDEGEVRLSELALIHRGWM